MSSSPAGRGRAAVFLDRDGTLNEEHGYVHRVEQWSWIPGAIDAIRLLNDNGYVVVVVSNQAGIARGYYGHDDVVRLHAQVDRWLQAEGARIDAWYWCPHHPEFGAPCACRKPAPGLLLQAAREHGLDLGRSFLVGDKLSDLDAAVAAGVRPILVATGYGHTMREQLSADVPCFASVLEAARHIADTPTLEIRDATEFDAQVVADLHARSWRSAYRGALSDAYLEGPIEAERLQVWRQRLTRPAANQFVAIAWQGARALGFVCLYGDEDAQWGSFVDNLHVLPECKRQGIGAQLMRRAAQWSLERYPSAGLYLWVLGSNLPAQRFYERIGGAQSGADIWQPPDGTPLPKLRYAWRDARTLAAVRPSG